MKTILSTQTVDIPDSGRSHGRVQLAFSWINPLCLVLKLSGVQGWDQDETLVLGFTVVLVSDPHLHPGVRCHFVCVCVYTTLGCNFSNECH